MSYAHLNTVDHFLLKTVLKKALIEGNHRQNLLDVFTDLYDMTRELYQEDDVNTTREYLEECFEEAIERCASIESHKTS